MPADSLRRRHYYVLELLHESCNIKLTVETNVLSRHGYNNSLNKDNWADGRGNWFL